MLYISIFIILVLLILEAVCRKYTCMSAGAKRILFEASAIVFLKAVRRTFLFEKLRSQLRRTETMNEKKADREAERVFTDITAKSLKLLLGLCLLVLVITLIPEEKKNSNTLKRPGVGEDSVKVSINLSKDGSEKTYDLELHPREYGSEEFKEIADKAYIYLNDIIKGDNLDLQNVMYDLKLPDTDETGTLRISWYSDDLLLVGTDGRVNSREITDAGNARLTAVLTDGIHDRELVWEVRVIPYTESDWSEKVEKLINGLEEGSREECEIVLPAEAEGATIKAETDEELSSAGKIMIFGIILTISYIILQFNKVKKSAVARQDEMLGRYSYFVSSIVLKVGSGLSIRETMISIYEDMSERGISDGLFEELKYIVNGLRAGRDEKTVYTEMGRGTGIDEYSRLMSLITRNLERGNSNLLELLRKEEMDAFNERKLRARRKGEEAAEKLLIPMFILLITVIGIVMFPALKNF